MAEAKLSGGKVSFCSLRSCMVFIITGVLCAVILIMGWMMMNMQKDVLELKERCKFIYTF